MILQKFGPNEKGRDFVVGDLHGCFDEFNLQLRDIRFDKKVDRMFSVGDLVDRGPKSLECLKLIKEDWFHSVRGNHEDMMINSTTEDSWKMDNWIMNGGGWYEETDEITELIEYAKNNLPIAIEIRGKHKRIGITHAEPPQEWSEDEIDFKQLDMLWARNIINKARRHDNYKMPDLDNLDETYHGHTVIDNMITFGKSTWIDTGCVYGRSLTILEIDTK